MSKRPRPQPGRKKRRELGLETYSPRLSQGQLDENHRQSVHEHYARNVDAIREKRRIQMAEKKRDKQLKRRRWDPPKKTKPSTEPELNSNPSSSRTSVRFHDVRAPSTLFDWEPRAPHATSEAGASPGTSVSRTSKELAAMSALVALAQPPIVSDKPASASTSTADSVLQMAKDLSDLDRHSAAGNEFCAAGTVAQHDGAPSRRPGASSPTWNEYGAAEHEAPSSRPPRGAVGDRGPHQQVASGRAKFSLMQQIHLECAGYMGPLSRVHAARIRVAELNSSALTMPTEEDRARWNARRRWRRQIIVDSGLLSLQQDHIIRSWTMDVDMALGRNEYLASGGETDFSGAD
ncbi:hypothetical protein C8J57DRAFT_1237388 [Mycena rebaudengoi]|nr:hypothetical protein C8J57DRAFT_1237388 [Mycena rebaudengoi]